MQTSDKPKHQEFTLQNVKHCEPNEAAIALANSNAMIIDVREQEELEIIKFDTEQIKHFPLSKIVDTFEQIPKDVPLIIACNNGIRSVKVVNLLHIQGFNNVTNLDGGILQWHRDGLPLILRQDIVDAGEHCGDGSSGCGCCGGH